MHLLFKADASTIELKYTFPTTSVLMSSHNLININIMLDNNKVTII